MWAVTGPCQPIQTTCGQWQTFLMAFLRLRHLQHRTGKYVIRHKSCLTLWRGLHQVVKYLNLILHVLLVCIKCQLYTDFFTSTGQNYRWLSVQWTCVHNALLTCSLQESSCVALLVVITDLKTNRIFGKVMRKIRAYNQTFVTSCSSSSSGAGISLANCGC